MDVKHIVTFARPALFAGVVFALPTLALSEQLTPIYDIQGAGHISPLRGETVTTVGIVTAVGFNFFYVQDALGDGVDATSDALYVFEPRSSEKPNVGDKVELTGEIEEFVPGGSATGNLTTTQFALPLTRVLSTGHALPDALVIGRGGRRPPTTIVITAAEVTPPINLQVPEDAANNPFDPNTDGIDFYESIEGMRVKVKTPQAISAVRQFGNFSSEFFVLANKGRDAQPRRALNRRGALILSADPDGYGDLHPEKIQIQLDGTLFGTDIPPLKVGDQLADINGVVGYSFGNFEVNATEALKIRRGSTAPEFSPLKGSDRHITIASYNVLNLSANADDDAQRAKIARQITANLNGPDVIALQEIQDNNGETDDGTVAADETLRLLVAAIVAAGGPSYESVDVAPEDGTSGGIPGGNIRNAFLFNPTRVALIEVASLTEESLDELGVSDPAAFTGTRAPLLATFSFRGKSVTIINNHLTSRFGSTPIFGAVQPFVQAGETQREAQATALNEVVATIQERSQNRPVVITGDFNTFEFTNDLSDLLPGSVPRRFPPLFNTINTARDAYTFIFDGNAQALDHFFVNNALRFRTVLDVVHVNVDFPRRFLDITASDHEPLLARIRL